MTTWDLRAFLRALGAALVGMVVIWLVTAASDEGQLAAGIRAGRTLPLSPLCSGVGAALAFATSRTRGEAIALEALGRSPSQSALGAALGAALPSILVAIAIAMSARVDVSAFYPRAASRESFVFTGGAFVSPSLGVSVAEDGALHALDHPVAPGQDLPAGARAASAAATALSGLALALVAARAMLRRSQLDRAARRRQRALAAAEATACGVGTLVAFQAAAARVTPAAVAVLPGLALLVVTALRYGARESDVPRPT